MKKYSIQVSNLSKNYILSDKKQNESLLSEEIQRFISGAFLSNKKKQKSNSFWALKNVSFNVKPGEIIGIIGPNGAGKSTLLKILSQITNPTQGRVILNGRVASLLEVGTGFNPELTGRENIYLNGSILGMSRKEIKNKFDEILDFSGVGDFIDEPVKHYSSGMYVRLAFSIAANLDADILLIDEILAVGDARFQKKSLGKVNEITHKDKRTVIFVSHDLNAIGKLCDKVILINKGRLKMYGESSKVIKYYLSQVNKNINYSENKVDLEKRMGTHEIYIDKVEMRGKKGRKIKSLKTGDNFSLRIYYKLKKGMKIENLLVGFLLKNDLDNPIFVQQNILSGVKFGQIKRNGYFEFFMSDFPIAAGTYYINCSLIKNSGIGGQYYDNINDVLKFEVTTSDYFGSGVLPSREHGSIYLKGRWKHYNK